MIGVNFHVRNDQISNEVLLWDDPIYVNKVGGFDE